MRVFTRILSLVLPLMVVGCPALLPDHWQIVSDGGPSTSQDASAGSGSIIDDSGTEGGSGGMSVVDVAISGNDGDAGSSGSGINSGFSGGDAGVGASCKGLAATCGPSRNASCCSSSVVRGGIFNRSNDPNYPASVSDFRLDTYEITVGRFRNFVTAYSQAMTSAGSGKNPHDSTDPGWSMAWNASLPADPAALLNAVKCDPTYETWTDSPGPQENLPINCIDWYEAFAFCVWDGGRLPTEAEWNYAEAGGSEQRQYPWGSTTPGANAGLAVYGCYYNGGGTPCTGVTNIAPVGSASAGNGKWGHSDLAGNVWEWTLDSYASPYAATPCVNCANTTVTSNRVLRGGSFNFPVSNLYPPSDRSSYFGPANSYFEVGARCARL